MVFSECSKAMGYSTLTYLVIESLVIDKVFAQLHACIGNRWYSTIKWSYSKENSVVVFQFVKEW